MSDYAFGVMVRTINRLLQFPPYAVNIEHRVPIAQAASVHDAEAELF